MSTKVLIPKAGMGITEATVSKWLKAVGERVTEGEPIVELELAKAIQEVNAPATGVLKRIMLQEGETAAVHTEIAEIE